LQQGFSSSGLHVRERDGEGVPLICLPPAPHSSLYFEPLYDALGKHPIKGVSYPGYGGSRRLEELPSIDAYAESILSICGNASVDLMGFHTGCLVAIALGELLADRLRHTIMIDVPFFDSETRKSYAAKLPAEGLPIPVEASFEKTVNNRSPVQSEDRAFTLWVETLRAGRYQADAFRAAFAFDCEERFAGFKQPVNILATTSGLLEPSRRAAQVLPNAELKELPIITAPVFDGHAATVADTLMTIIKS